MSDVNVHDELYATIDLAVVKIKRLVKKQKRKLNRRKPKQ